MPPSSSSKPDRGSADVAGLLSAAVAGIGGAERTGQVTMARAVQHAIESGEHLAVQAGTGTGKSLAYLVPAARHAVASGGTVVVSTATIALQRQLVDRDLPRLAATLAPALGRAPEFAILKGREITCACSGCVAARARMRARLCLILAWCRPSAARCSGCTSGRRRRRPEIATSWCPESANRPGARSRSAPASASGCSAASSAPSASPSSARDEAGKADIVVTNHALLAIDALEDFDIFPEHEVVIIDEAHDLTDRVTSVASDELSAPAVEFAARRCGKMIDEKWVARLRDSGGGVERLLADVPAGRIDVLDDALEATLESVRDAAAGCAAEFRTTAKASDEEPERIAARRSALAAIGDLYDAADRMLGAFGAGIADRTDVVWMDRPAAEESGRPATLRVAPLRIGGLLASRLFGQRTVVLTSATLALGGSFEPLARQWGLARSPEDGAGAGAGGTPGDSAASDSDDFDPADLAEQHSLAWSGIDVGSPFDHPRSAILYVAKHLPPPGRDGLDESYLTELTELIEAAGGRTLGLFSSMRAARQATEQLRGRIEFPLLCQGDDQTSQLVTQFAADEPTCLFGTLSLWQGVDVPGSSLQLVVIDRIPFPRPDDPLASARQRAVAARGGNGFMSVSATQAALLLAQGTGRLLRTMTDRGVVAVLDPRLSTARYSGFLRSSLPPYWTTTDPQVARGALRRLAASASSSSSARRTG